MEIFGDAPRCHTAGMKNPPPKNPRVNQTWVDDDGVLHVWDGTDWLLYEDLPFFEPDPLYRRPDRDA